MPSRRMIELAVCVVVLAGSLTAVRGDWLVGHRSNGYGQIRRYDDNGVDWIELVPADPVLNGGLMWPMGMAVQDGLLLVPDRQLDSIFVYDLLTGKLLFRSAMPDGAGVPHDIEPFGGGKFLLTSHRDNSLYTLECVVSDSEFRLEWGPRLINGDDGRLRNPVGVIWDAKNEFIYVAGDVSGAIHRYSTDGVELDMSKPIDRPHDMALHPGRYLVITSRESNLVHTLELAKFDTQPPTEAKLDPRFGIDFPYGVETHDGHVYVVSRGPAGVARQGKVFEFTDAEVGLPAYADPMPGKLLIAELNEPIDILYVR